MRRWRGGFEFPPDVPASDRKGAIFRGFLQTAMVMLGISPAVDFAFLKTFGDPVNRGPVIGFLNSVLKSAHPTVDVTVETPFSFPEFAAHKF